MDPYKFPNDMETVEGVAAHAASILPSVDFLGEMKQRIATLRTYMSVRVSAGTPNHKELQSQIDELLPTINHVLARECLASELFAPGQEWRSASPGQWIDGQIKARLGIKTSTNWSSSIDDLRRHYLRYEYEHAPSLFDRIESFVAHEATRLAKKYGTPTAAVHGDAFVGALLAARTLTNLTGAIKSFNEAACALQTFAQTAACEHDHAIDAFIDLDKKLKVATGAIRPLLDAIEKSNRQRLELGTLEGSPGEPASEFDLRFDVQAEE